MFWQCCVDELQQYAVLACSFLPLEPGIPELHNKPGEYDLQTMMHFQEVLETTREIEEYVKRPLASRG